MSQTITVRQALRAQQALPVLGRNAQTKGLQSSFKVAKVMAPVAEELSLIGEQAERHRQKLLKQFATLDKKGNIQQDESGAVQFEDGKEEEFQIEYQSLLEEEMDLDNTLNLSQLDGLVEVSPEVLMWLVPIITE